ncbi:ATP-dependent RNA helicase DDX55-like [Oppia nitens]|uniref:ATP-dependent RNA helicase DDX55-like n=1 Tax=Oppia nitens TaxID=1686743 RepID=UPI0023DB71CC|nr:ATP-dependent RNA helicase DDX55-like [Oppia nitens]
MSLSWSTLNVHKCIIKVVKKSLKFAHMTAVQSAVIPLFVSNKDCAVEAVTGSGKTLAFVIPIIDILLKKSSNESIKKTDVGAIVVSPTRELAQQIYEVLNQFIVDNKNIPLKGLLLIGGTSVGQDIDRYKTIGANIVVSTPGRLCDMFEKCDLFASRVRQCLEVFVLDEADLILSMGFETALNNILSYLPKQRRTGLFSATQTKKLDQLIRAGLRNPVKVEIKEKYTDQSASGDCLQMPQLLHNHYVCLDSCEEKLAFVISLVRQQPNAKYLVFMSTCAQVNYFSNPITKFIQKVIKQFVILKLHRKLKKSRQKIFDEFRKCKSGLLLCTDVMSRGVDIPQVDWVIHLDLPNTIEDYVHRCGRSGHQVGVTGNTLVIVLPTEMEFLELCESKGVDVKQLQTNLNVDKNLKNNVIEFMKKESRKHKTYYELGMQAFVSFIRTYSSKHCMSTILYKKLDINDIANGYALLKVPAMPELRHRPRGSSMFKTSPDDIRIAKNFKQQNFLAKDPNKEKFDKNRLKPVSKNAELIKKTKLKGKRKKEFINDLDIQELAEDAKMVKKLKKGLISSQQFDEHFGL